MTIKKRIPAVFLLLISLFLSPEISYGQHSEMRKEDRHLLVKYLPTLVLSQKDEHPINPADVLPYSTLRREKTKDAVPKPSVADLKKWDREDSYIDLDVTKIKNDLSKLKPTLVGRVVRSGGLTFLQYYLFFASSTLPAKEEIWHEGDVEMFQVVLKPDGKPDGINLSQHYHGEYLPWKDVEKHAGHPVIFVAEGSHALYGTREAKFLRSGLGPANVFRTSRDKLPEKNANILILSGENLVTPEEGNWRFTWKGRFGGWPDSIKDRSNLRKKIADTGGRHAPRFPAYRNPLREILGMYHYPKHFYEYTYQYTKMDQFQEMAEKSPGILSWGLAFGLEMAKVFIGDLYRKKTIEEYRRSVEKKKKDRETKEGMVKKLKRETK